MKNRMSRAERSLEYLIGKVKKLDEWNKILEEKVLNLEGINGSKSKDLLSSSEKQAIIEHGAKFKPTNNQKRDNVIRKAKQFIALHKGDGQKQHSFPKMRAFIFYDIDFKVNKNKRTVTGYLIGTHTGHVHKKVTIQCHPDDVFNVDLGKAIVVGRLLGLDVSEFEDAPQPDEVVVGQLVKSKNNKEHTWKVVSIEKDSISLLIVDSNYKSCINAKTTVSLSDNEGVIFWDDTNAKYQ